MHRLIAITLLIIHLFNTGGYQVVFDRLEMKVAVQMKEKLDNEEYRDEELIEMKVPLPMPYQNNWPAFERYNGEIMIDGVHYSYVKRKVWNDTLIVLCIPNHEKMTLNSAKEQFFSLVNDLDQKGKDVPAPKANVVKSITTDYQGVESIDPLPAPVHTIPEQFIANTDLPSSIYLEDPSRPPQVH
jgi:hypothetical protein